LLARLKAASWAGERADTLVVEMAVQKAGVTAVAMVEK